jgi:hypothetical protein
MVKCSHAVESYLKAGVAKNPLLKQGGFLFASRVQAWARRDNGSLSRVDTGRYGFKSRRVHHPGPGI